METELKFALSPDAHRMVEKLVGHEGETTRHNDVSTYFDTPDLRLHKAGFSLRVRRGSDRHAYVQTVKAAGDSQLNRNEWEWPVEREVPELGVLREVPGLSPVLDGHGEDLREIFRTEVEREQQTLHPMPGAAAERRHAAHQDAKKAIAEPAFARFVLALRAWSQPGAGATGGRHAGRRLAKAAPDLLDRLERELAKRLDKADPDDAPSLHAVRKSAKKLRYGIEYFEGVYGDAAGKYLKRCNHLQKRLGVLNDLQTATVRAGELADRRIDLVSPLGLLAGWGGRQARTGAEEGAQGRAGLRSNRGLLALTVAPRPHPLWRSRDKAMTT